MRQRISTIAMLLWAGSIPLSLAWGHGPVCREPTVVDEMAREIRSQNYYSRVDARLVTEQPGLDPSVVRCQVCVESAPYDMTRFGDRPVARCLPHDFEVRIVPAGFVVRDLR